MSTKLGKIVADFTTSLATAATVSATTITIQSATDDDGVSLPSGTYYFTIDGDNSSKEHIQCSLSGTTLSSIKSVSRQGALTTGFARAHRVGASVSITTFAHILYMKELLDGTTDLDATDPLKYDGTATISNANHLATKDYVDGVAIAGGADASTTVKGITKLSTAPASATSPIAVGDNDGRVPSQDENDALAATTTPSSSNKYITQKDFQKGAELYAADAGSTDTYAITLSPAPAAYVAGMVVRFKANTANTGACTINVNSLGAKTIKKKYDQDLNDNDILANQFVELIYDGTNFQLIGDPASSFFGLYASGSTTRDISTASGAQNIAHGLGRTPKGYRLMAVGPAGQVAMAINNNKVSHAQTNLALGGGNSFTVYDSGGGASYIGTLSADATNITISWTKSGAPTGTAYIIWEAFA